MKHYLKKLEETVKSQWHKAALCDYGGESLSYCNIATEVEKYHFFFKAAGVKKGDKIAICGRNSARWGVSFWAVNTYGAVAVPILSDFLPETIAELTDHSGSVLLFTDADIWEKMNPSAMPGLLGAISIKDESLLWAKDDVRKAWLCHEDDFLNAYPKDFRPQDVKYPTDNENDLAIINYTSGTSGSPKGVMLTYGAVSDTVEFSQVNMPNSPKDNIVSMLPMAHMYGFAIEFVYPCCSGCAIYFLGKTPAPSTLLKAMKEVKPYLVVTVPLVMEKIYESSIKPAISKQPVKTLLLIPGIRSKIYATVRNKLTEAFGGNVRAFIMGGAALNPEVEKVLRRIHLNYTVGYGMTEACPLLAYEAWENFVPGSCGKPVHDLRIDSTDPQHVPGEIQARGANLTIGYYNNPEANEAAFTPDGWFRTGDLGIIDQEGNVFIRGRIKSMILGPSGQNIYPEDIERALATSPAVSESLAVDREGKVVALVYLDQNYLEELPAEAVAALPEQIRKTANVHLPSYSRISKVEIMDKPFEKTPKLSIKRYLYK
ncbi:MAG: AMP-binding protein [Bacteroidales bacterium]|nr:AMP-binding protein [Bacteroidales bacterium]